MNLGQGGGTQGFRVKVGEQRSWFLSQFLSDHTINVLQWHLRCSAVQNLHGVNIFFRQKVIKRTNVLTNFDEHSSILLTKFEQGLSRSLMTLPFHRLVICLGRGCSLVRK